jgi:hypothetical protein
MPQLFIFAIVHKTTGHNKRKGGRKYRQEKNLNTNINTNEQIFRIQPHGNGTPRTHRGNMRLNVLGKDRRTDTPSKESQIRKAEGRDIQAGT